MKDLNSLIKWINKYKESYNENVEEFKLDLSFEKRILEVIGVPHKIEGRIDKNGDVKVILDRDDAYTLIHTLSKEISRDDLDNSNISTLEALNNVSPVIIKDKAPIYIGTRVGRPEKSKERLMRPAPHVLFPIGNFGGNRRLVAEASKKRKNSC